MKLVYVLGVRDLKSPSRTTTPYSDYHAFFTDKYEKEAIEFGKKIYPEMKYPVIDRFTICVD